MRPFETWLLAALSLALLILSVPHWRRTRWPRMSAVVALLIGAAQILAEGPRWQLLPAYALTVLLCWFSDLVSHGYVVVALDQPGVAAAVVFPDGHQAAGLTLAQFQPVVRPSYMPQICHPPLGGLPQPGGKAPSDNSIVPYLARDVAFALDQLATLNQADPAGILAGKLDLQRVGAFGISLGGIVVGEACRIDPRLRACLMMDAPASIGVVRAGLKQPGMWIAVCWMARRCRTPR